MGRELRRVPLDFEWPVNQVWKGYLNPYASQKCKSCDGSGLSPEWKALSNAWYDHLSPTGRGWGHELTQDEIDVLVAEGRLRDLTHDFDPARVGAERWRPRLVDGVPYRPTCEEVNDWSRRGRGHDACNRWICVKVRAGRLGLGPSECRWCGGTGRLWFSDEIEALHEQWEGYDPPGGEGYQLWETTSEGSPVSPVFATLDELCHWCATGATTPGSFRATAQEWKAMLAESLVCHRSGNAVFL